MFKDVKFGIYLYYRRPMFTMEYKYIKNNILQTFSVGWLADS